MTDVIVILIFVVIMGVGCYEAWRSRLDPFQPIYYVLLGFLWLLCLQYGVGRSELREWFRPSDLNKAMTLALVGVCLFVFGYYSSLATRVAKRLPKPVRQWRPGRLTPCALGLVALALGGQLWFIARSGGLVHFLSRARGAGDYESNTAYLYGLKWLLTPGIIFLAVDNARFRGLRRYIWVPLAVGWFLYHFAMGQRGGVFSTGVLTAACLAVPRGRRHRPGLVLLTVAVCVAAVGFVARFRAEFHAGSEYRGVQRFSGMPLDEKLQTLAVGAVTGGRRGLGRRGELPMYVDYVRIFPDSVDFDYGLEYSQLLVAWFPRLLWPSRPDWREPKRRAINEVLGTSHLDGPTGTMFGVYYTHFGALSLFIGAYLTGVALGAVARMRDLWPRSMGVMLVFLSFFNVYGLPAGNGLVHSFRFWGVWVLAPVVAAHFYLRAVAGRSGPARLPEPEHTEASRTSATA